MDTKLVAVIQKSDQSDAAIRNWFLRLGQEEMNKLREFIDSTSGTEQFLLQYALGKAFSLAVQHTVETGKCNG